MNAQYVYYVFSPMERGLRSGDLETIQGWTKLDTEARSFADVAPDPKSQKWAMISGMAIRLRGFLGMERIAELIPRVKHLYELKVEAAKPSDVLFARVLETVMEIARRTDGIALDLYALRSYTVEDFARLIEKEEMGVLDFISIAVTEEAGSLWLRVRGMIKWGRPDLVVYDIRRQDAHLAATVLNSVATYLAAGNEILPGQTMQLGPGVLTFAAAQERVKGEFFPNGALEVQDLDLHTGKGRRGLSGFARALREEQGE